MSLTFYISNVDSKCGSRDHTSTADFGDLARNGDPPIASECTWLIPVPGLNNDIVESDVRFNTTDFHFTNRPNDCTIAYDLEAVATHEFGHTFGLGHVGEIDHGEQTMSRDSPRCSAGPRSLGRGDVYGLRNTY